MFSKKSIYECTKYANDAFEVYNGKCVPMGTLCDAILAAIIPSVCGNSSSHINIILLL